MKTLLAALTLFAAAPAVAHAAPVDLDTSEAVIAVVTSDAAEGELPLSVLLDDDARILQIGYTISGKDPQRFPIGNLKDGIVVLEKSGMNVVVLNSATFDPQQGGPITVTYLKNGLTNAHGKLEIELDRQGDRWIASVNERSGRRAFTRMFALANRVLGAVVGIASITVQ